MKNHHHQNVKMYGEIGTLRASEETMLGVLSGQHNLEVNLEARKLFGIMCQVSHSQWTERAPSLGSL